jgi:hypothetical protein
VIYDLHDADNTVTISVINNSPPYIITFISNDYNSFHSFDKKRYCQLSWSTVIKKAKKYRSNMPKKFFNCGRTLKIVLLPRIFHFRIMKIIPGLTCLHPGQSFKFHAMNKNGTITASHGEQKSNYIFWTFNRK